MTTIKLLSAASIVIATLTTPAAAHENAMAARHVALKSNTNAYSTTDRWIYGHARIAGESDTALQTQPGGVCDHGDNPAIC
ncbi:hypothetical protein [Bradyrhizobium iriomotense]|uniref:Uncharacterized protein n=1 Tax=Bradyrhizobium iriomotense TaxID=441950 RepID=A0ABQ6APU2_9BRAD|nr:hypothetical protein [Bradyrhizobium iriomotense]GLR84264.1 hypothetical protein GCM10007857_09740 [Bradyrhizobium iriomotense]